MNGVSARLWKIAAAVLLVGSAGFAFAVRTASASGYALEVDANGITGCGNNPGTDC